MKIISNKYQINLMKYYRNTSVQISMGIVLSLFISAIFITFAIKPTLITITKLNKEITKSIETSSILRQKIINLDKAAKIVEELKGDFPLLERAIPNGNEVYTRLSNDIELISQASNVSLISFNVGEAVLYTKINDLYEINRNQVVMEMPITIKVFGQYPRTFQFLKQVLSIKRLIGIDSINFSREGNSKLATGINTTLAISGHVYYLGDKTIIEKILIPEKKK